MLIGFFCEKKRSGFVCLVVVSYCDGIAVYVGCVDSEVVVSGFCYGQFVDEGVVVA